VRAQDGHGERLEIDAEGLAARVIQHEMDHLDGVLILDRIPREARKEAMRLGVDPKQSDQMVRGTVPLPHGSGKTVRVGAVNAHSHEPTDTVPMVGVDGPQGLLRPVDLSPSPPAFATHRT
jgi:hypothetical protein